MNTETILAELMMERDKINRAIEALRGGGGGTSPSTGKVGRPRGPMSEETKQKMRDAWAKRRKLKLRKEAKEAAK